MLGTGECVCECTYKPSEVYTAPKVVDPESARHKGLIHPGANARSPSEEGARHSPGGGPLFARPDSQYRKTGLLGQWNETVHVSSVGSGSVYSVAGIALDRTLAASESVASVSGRTRMFIIERVARGHLFVELSGMTYTQRKLNSALKESRGSVKDDFIRITARRCLHRGKDVCATSSRPFPSTASDDDSAAKPLTQLFIERPIERIAFLRRDSTAAQEGNNRKRSGQRRIGIDQNDCEPCNRSMRKKFVRALGDPASTKLQGSAAVGVSWMRCKRYVQEVPNLSRVGPTRGGLTIKQSPYAKHMRKAIASPMETRVVHSETRVTSCGGPAPDTKLAFYFVACCYRAINSGPHTLCMPTLLGDPLSMTLVFCVLFTRIEEEEEEKEEEEEEERGAKGRKRS
ncbi:hypothetical protein G5I_03425 [Acromyrmex echinatior]|uniref:Uncharacterized protein n=1 Tax=Acromyrmex echinatior TaxID=103372 RepID=F4WCZ1_ACREC|nr:hypothetical protein G5I_03425 [Acromyrmex echinatior]